MKGSKVRYSRALCSSYAVVVVRAGWCDGLSGKDVVILSADCASVLVEALYRFECGILESEMLSFEQDVVKSIPYYGGMWRVVVQVQVQAMT